MAHRKPKKTSRNKKRTSNPKQVDAVRHKDKRKNIPTEELRGFMAEEEQQPSMVEYEGLLYARDPSLDPQLVWKGKDEQDREPLTVPAVPVYIQEKVHPQAIVEEVKAQARQEAGHEQLDLFADFNNLPQEFSERVDFYHHEANWSNRMILGDSLLVMTSLAEKEALKGQVQTIYIDPPYGIKFASNWQVSTRKRDVKDGKVEDATRQPEQVRAFRDTWKLGIHSYLSYWRDRLTAARELLTETGSIFVQMGDENVHLVRCMLDEVFGSENFIAQIAFQKTAGQSSRFISAVYDYVLWYGRNSEQTKYRPLYQPKVPGDEGAVEYKMLQLPDGAVRKATDEEVRDFRLLPKGARLFSTYSLFAAGESTKGLGTFEFGAWGKWATVKCPAGYHFKVGDDQSKLRRLVFADRLLPRNGQRILKRYLDDLPYTEFTNYWPDTRGEPGMVYVVQTTTRLVTRCLLMTTDPGDLVLDPTCGSGTTAYVAEQWGRRWITIDTSRVSLALARTRLMAARYPYYLLADSPEGQKKEAEITGRPMSMAKTQGDVKKGFVYHRVPHVTLKAIANNEEIDDIHARWQERLEPIREELNEALGQDWREWQVPRVPDDADGWKSLGIDPKSKPAKLLKEWWDLRKKRQDEIDASIARVADQEILYDQPYEDGRKVRVTGPFTVESLSPHRTISAQEKKARAEEGMPEVGVTVETRGPNEFGNIILENLKKAGVQNTIKNERLTFDTLDPFPGQWIHGEGRYTEKDGTERRAAVAIGPEHGTVDADFVKEAAKEAVQGVGFDVLIVCGFAFDPAVNEETKRYGKLVVLPCRMNADLAMGNEFLKKTGSANLFMVFGEPDLAVERTEEGKITVEVRGVDIYDPTTGEIRSNSTDDIACWFIDTNYDGESFFVRHAYFCGADRPYDKLKRALRAEIDEAAWETLYRTESRPFDPPATGKIAVKVINHYGDEVLRVYEVEP